MRVFKAPRSWTRAHANRFDVKWVMGQVGHADSKMTMDVYAHLQQRLKREQASASTRSSVTQKS